MNREGWQRTSALAGEYWRMENNADQKDEQQAAETGYPPVRTFNGVVRVNHHCELTTFGFADASRVVIWWSVALTPMA